MTPAAIEAVLADFRHWLEQCADAADAAPPTGGEPPVDLATLVGAFTALRHEVHLQTKAARSQAEQSADALALLHDTLDRLGTPKPAAIDEESRALTSLMEAADVLARTGRGLQQALDAAPNSRWGRWFGGRDSAILRSALASALDGVRLGQARLDRALQTHGLEAIPAVGFPFDAETMEAIETVPQSAHSPGTVVDEIRIGYLSDGAVFRIAQVRVAR